MGKNTKVVKTSKPSKNEYKRDKKVIFKEKHKKPKEKKKINWIIVLIVIIAIIIVVEVALVIAKRIKIKKAQDSGTKVESTESQYVVRKFGNGQATLPVGWTYLTRTDDNDIKILDIYPNEDDLITISSAQYQLSSLKESKDEMYQQLYDSATANIEISQKHPLKDIQLGNYTYKTSETYIIYKNEVYIRPLYYMSMKDGYLYSITITSTQEITDEALDRYKEFFDSIKF